MATAHAALDKGAMREVWKAYGVSQPDFLVITRFDEIAPFASGAGFPLVIKPVDCGGGGRRARFNGKKRSYLTCDPVCPFFAILQEVPSNMLTRISAIRGEC